MFKQGFLRPPRNTDKEVQPKVMQLWNSVQIEMAVSREL